MDNQPLAVYDTFRAQLAELGAHNNSLVFDYATPAGNKDARSHIYKLRQVKSALDKARKTEKEASLEYGRRVDGEAKAIVEQIEKMILVHQKPLDEIEAREKERIEKHQAGLLELQDSVAQMPLEWMSLPFQHMKDRLAGIQTRDFTAERWEEFLTEALLQKDKAVKALTDAIGRREKHDAEQAELVKLRAQAEAQTKKDNEERIAKEAAERATREAEAKAAHEKQEAANKTKRDKDAADKKLLEEKLRNERLEREKAEAEQRARDSARETEERIKRETEAKAKKDADDLARREADKKHRASVNNAAVAAFAKDGVTEATARRVVELIAKKHIPNVVINY
jgi:hypothetical protein